MHARPPRQASLRRVVPATHRLPEHPMTIDRILVAVSFSERSIDAIRKAARLAADRDSIITLLHVVEPVKRRSVRRLPAQQTLLRSRVTHARKELARFA